MRHTAVSTQAHRARRAAAGIGVLAAAVALAACGSSGTVKAGSSGGGSSTTTAAPAATGGITISAGSVSGLGTVLVDGSGNTLYLLTADQGGKITCTSGNSCTATWPAVVLPSGQSSAQAGSGIQASLLGTVKDSSGVAHVTYGGWPLYTYSSDHSSGQAAGQDVTDTWGTWYVLGVDGQPIKTHMASATTTTAPQSGGAGF